MLKQIGLRRLLKSLYDKIFPTASPNVLLTFACQAEACLLNSVNLVAQILSSTARRNLISALCIYVPFSS